MNEPHSNIHRRYYPDIPTFIRALNKFRKLSQNSLIFSSFPEDQIQQNWQFRFRQVLWTRIWSRIPPHLCLPMKTSHVDSDRTLCCLRTWIPASSGAIRRRINALNLPRQVVRYLYRHRRQKDRASFGEIWTVLRRQSGWIWLWPWETIWYFWNINFKMLIECMSLNLGPKLTYLWALRAHVPTPVKFFLRIATLNQLLAPFIYSFI